MTELANLIAQAGLTGTSSDLYQVMRSVRGGQLDFDATDTGTADAVICQVGIPHAQILAGLPFTFIKGPAANATATPTLTITDQSGNNGLMATIVKSSGAVLGKGDLPANALITVRAISASKFALVSLLTISDVIALLQSGAAFYGTDTGAVNALAVTLTPAPTAYGGASGIQLLFVKVANTNSGAATINVNGLGTKAIVNDASAGALVGGELLAGKVVLMVYDGTSFRLLTQQGGLFGGGSFGSGGSLGGTAVTNWVVPAGVTRVRVRCYGGGGGGGGSSGGGAGGAGGGAGGYAEGIYSVTPGQTIVVTAGTPGNAGGAGTSNSGANGGSSSFGSYCSATGGGGGLGSGGGAQTNVSPSVGGGGVNGNTLNIGGSAGTSAAIATSGVAFSGSGGHSYVGAGGGGTFGSGNNGAVLSGGGSGGANGGAGGNGGLGLVVVEYLG